MRRSLTWQAVLTMAAVSTAAAAESTTVIMHEVSAEGVGGEIGAITFTDTSFGLLIEPDLGDAAPGLHGTHIHQNPDCGVTETDGVPSPAGAAGGHYDPDGAKSHQGPYGDGHLGDLPNLIVEDDGVATMTVLAPRVTVADLNGRALVMHAGPDRYDGEEMGGARVYCGVFD